MLPTLTIAEGSTAKSRHSPFTVTQSLQPERRAFKNANRPSCSSFDDASEPVLDRINQSHLTTIDPLLAVEA